MIATPLEADLAERIAGVPGVRVLFAAELLPAPRYPSDHRGGDGFVRDAAGEKRWNAMLAVAEVLYGIPGESGSQLAAAISRAPALRWVQGTYAGAGEQVRAAHLAPADLERITFTTSAGVHGGMLAEFAFFGLLALRKDALRLDRIRSARGWDHFAMDELDGSTIAVVGMGNIGQALAHRARAFGMHVIGVTRTGQAHPAADETVPIDAATDAYRRADAIVATLPGTEATRHLIDRATIASWKPSAVFINVGRGTVVDQAALVDALVAGAIHGAVLDVCDPEPLPPDNPLWTLPNVIFSPHTAALSVHENERIVELFCDNLRRYAAGIPLRNVVDIHEFY
ncbi:MAG: D-2-hydroxyacid dehydrogenase [Candidatus Velthaea sp.]|jgi:phosphoglycerate dehydrogenase-like enzyme